MEPSSLPIVALGFVLGMKHALDVDHLAAVATLAAGRRDRWRSLLVGVWWGLGHSATLLLVGGAILFLGVTFPPRISSALEFSVGVMLVGLGLRVLLRLRKGGTLHVHAHEHGGRLHVHPHIHGPEPAHPAPDARRAAGVPRVPGHHAAPTPPGRTPRASLLVGMVHGAAGSAGLTLLLLPAIPSRAMGLLYLAVFGAGSILGMSLASLVVSVPFGFLREGGRSGRVVSWLAGGLGVAVGVVLMVQTGGSVLGF